MWTTSILPESCRLVVEETLPRGMYVDPDQLRDLRAMTGLKTYVEACVDIEAAIFDEPPTRSFVLTASAFKVVRQMIRGYVPC